MAMPPEDLSPEELWVKLQECPRPTEVVDFPRKDPATGRPLSRIRIQVLTVDEHTKARMEGRRKVMEEHKVASSDLDDVVMREIVSDACAKEALKLACLAVKPFDERASVKRYPYMFATDERLSALTSDEVVTLFNAYTLVQQKYGPFSENITTDDEYNAWIRVLTEGARYHFLARKSLLQLAELSIGLARRAYVLSLIVESLLADSQSISAADLKSLGIGTSWFTGLRLTSTGAGFGLSSSHIDVEPELGETEEDLDDVLSEALYGIEPGEAITIERAVELAKRQE